ARPLVAGKRSRRVCSVKFSVCAARPAVNKTRARAKQKTFSIAASGPTLAADNTGARQIVVSAGRKGFLHEKSCRWGQLPKRGTRPGPAGLRGGIRRVSIF